MNATAQRLSTIGNRPTVRCNNRPWGAQRGARVGMEGGNSPGSSGEPDAWTLASCSCSCYLSNLERCCLAQPAPTQTPTISPGFGFTLGQGDRYLPQPHREPHQSRLILNDTWAVVSQSTSSQPLQLCARPVLNRVPSRGSIANALHLLPLDPNSLVFTILGFL